MFRIHVLLVLVTHQCLNIAEQCLHSLEVFFFIIIIFSFFPFFVLCPDSKWAGCTQEVAGEATQWGQLNQRDIPYYMASFSATNAWGSEEEGVGETSVVIAFTF